jgi:hypothetical protein
MKPRKDSADKGAGSGCMARLVRFFYSLWKTLEKGHDLHKFNSHRVTSRCVGLAIVNCDDTQETVLRVTRNIKRSVIAPYLTCLFSIFVVQETNAYEKRSLQRLDAPIMEVLGGSILVETEIDRVTRATNRSESPAPFEKPIRDNGSRKTQNPTDYRDGDVDPRVQELGVLWCGFIIGSIIYGVMLTWFAFKIGFFGDFTPWGLLKSKFPFLANVKEHAPLSAGANVDHGVEVETTGEHENRAADRGCCVSSCSHSSVPAGGRVMSHRSGVPSSSRSSAAEMPDWPVLPSMMELNRKSSDHDQ